MKKMTIRSPEQERRRRFLGLLGGLGAAGLVFPLLPTAEKRRELELKEADFYRPHELAG